MTCVKKKPNQTNKKPCNNDLTLPAGTDGELGFDLGSVQWIILRHQEGLKGGSIHEQGHSGEFHIQHIVMPLFVAHLEHTRGGR